MDKVAGINAVTIELGDEVLSFVPVGTTAELMLGDCYLPFLSDAAPDIVFHVHAGPAPYAGLGAPVFETPRWTMHRTRERLVIGMRHPEFGISESVAIDLAARRGDVYCTDMPRRQGRPRMLLGYPLGELLFLTLLAEERGVLLHASGVGDGGRGLLFCGVSGAGKSTLTRLWQEHAEATPLSDDRVIVRKRAGRFWAYGTPWHGDAPVISARSFPLECVFVIGHAPANSVRRLGSAEAATSLLARSFPPFWDVQQMAFTLAFLDELVRAVPCYALGFVPDQSVVEFVRCVR